MSELEKELQQMEAQYGEEFGDASDSEEVENSEEGGILLYCFLLHEQIHNKQYYYTINIIQ